VRLVHPFPSALTAVATCVIALVAGTDAGIAVRLGLAMLALQFAIGAANDFADADRDRMGRPDKPIPGGLVSLREAQIVFVVFAIAGLALAATVRLEALGIALLGLSDGLLYDLRLKGRTLSWLPMAIGVAILPVFAWAGSTGTWPPGLIWIALVAFLAGASLAMMNALADVEVDKAAGITSIAVRLGWDATLALNMGLMAVLQLIVGFSTAISDAPLLALVAEAAGVLLTWVGWRLASLWDVQAARRGWELQAVGIALLGIGWLAALAATGALT
jgi:4-hydroxybenzoate polyprenyltransferase